MNKLSLHVGAIAAMALMAGSAHAVSCTGVSLGTSSTSDFTLGGADSTACVISTVNPDQGPGGNSSGFSPTFGGGWTLLSKINGGSSPKSLGGVSYNWDLSFDTTKNGDWEFGANKTVKLDLVVAMHAANRSGAFWFDDATLVANQTQSGSWVINWVNNGGNRPDYSNSSLWVRDVTVVPEPETYALALAGLLGVGFLVRRRKIA